MWTSVFLFSLKVKNNHKNENFVKKTLKKMLKKKFNHCIFKSLPL